MPQGQVNVFEADVELLDVVPVGDRERARARGFVPAVALNRGPWYPERPGDRGHLGQVVLEGVLSHRMKVGDREAIELVGPGDVLRPWVEPEEDSVPWSACWRVEADVRLAVLGPEFFERITPWPQITCELMGRLTLRTRRLGLELAIAANPRVDRRLLFALWYCADRWGIVTPEGVCIHVPLTHDLLSELVGARRPSVTTAAVRLEQQGKLRRTSGRGWLLLGEPPSSAVN